MANYKIKCCYTSVVNTCSYMYCCICRFIQGSFIYPQPYCSLFTWKDCERLHIYSTIALKTKVLIFGERTEEEVRKGFYHGVVRGGKQHDQQHQYSDYDFGLIEDEETGKLVKVELSDIAFTDRPSIKELEKYLEEAATLRQSR